MLPNQCLINDRQSHVMFNSLPFQRQIFRFLSDNNRQALVVVGNVHGQMAIHTITISLQSDGAHVTLETALFIQINELTPTSRDLQRESDGISLLHGTVLMPKQSCRSYIVVWLKKTVEL